MKRLVRKAASKILYHGTSAQRLAEIYENGAIGTDEYTDNGGDENVVYLASGFSMAEHYGSNVAFNSIDTSLPDWSVVLEIQVDTNNLVPDMDDWDTSVSENPTWEDSLEELGQVIYNGKIPTSQILKVTNCYHDGLVLNNYGSENDMDESEVLEKITSMFRENSSLDNFYSNWYELETE